MSRQCNVNFLLIAIGMLLAIPSSAMAQVNNNSSGWTDHTSEKCKVSFEYPSNWTLKTKKGPFDTNMSSEIELYNPKLDMTGLFPSFSVLGCLDLEVANQMLQSLKLNPFTAPLLANKTIHDAKSLSIISESMVTQTFSTISMLESISNVSASSFDFKDVEGTRVSPKFIDGEDTGIFSYIATNTTNGVSKQVAGQSYSVIHNGTAYIFTYNDDLANFELPENMQTRERILKSIQFLN